jgi:hypothetical protein
MKNIDPLTYGSLVGGDILSLESIAKRLSDTRNVIGKLVDAVNELIDLHFTPGSHLANNYETPVVKCGMPDKTVPPGTQMCQGVLLPCERPLIYSENEIGLRSIRDWSERKMSSGSFYEKIVGLQKLWKCSNCGRQVT